MNDEKAKILAEARDYIWGFCCRACGGGGMRDEAKCTDCGGCGIINWNTDWLSVALDRYVRSLVPSAIDPITAVRDYASGYNDCRHVILSRLEGGKGE